MGLCPRGTARFSIHIFDRGRRVEDAQADSLNFP